MDGVLVKTRFSASVGLYTVYYSSCVMCDLIMNMYSSLQARRPSGTSLITDGVVHSSSSVSKL